MTAANVENISKDLVAQAFSSLEELVNMITYFNQNRDAEAPPEKVKEYEAAYGRAAYCLAQAKLQVNVHPTERIPSDENALEITQSKAIYIKIFERIRLAGCVFKVTKVRRTKIELTPEGRCQIIEGEKVS